MLIIAKTAPIQVPFIAKSLLSSLSEIDIGEAGGHAGADAHLAVGTIEIIVVLTNPD